MKKKVAIGFLGTTLDNVLRPHRHTFWRPTISLIKSAERPFDRIELLHNKGAENLRAVIREDLTAYDPALVINEHSIKLDDPWRCEEVYSALFDFAEKYPFDTEKEDYYIHITTGTHVAQICLFILTADGFLPGCLIQTSPPEKTESEDSEVVKDKSVGKCQIIDLDLTVYENIVARFRRRGEMGGAVLKSGIATRNLAFNELIAEIESVAGISKDAILLTGATGAGKTKLAEKIYELKKTRNLTKGRFVALNCATLRGDTAMSTIFGHVKGSFTGAVTERKGLLEEAHQGVLFLDEIGELGLSEQAMLLHAIETGVYRPVGSNRDFRSEFQLICGTNRDLLVEVREGRFREDLLSRINLWQFRLPALSERREDIEPNVAFELALAERRHGRKFLFAEDAKTQYMTFALSDKALWSGNFRDLSSSIQRLTTLCLSTGRIDSNAVHREIGRLCQQWGCGPDGEGAVVAADLASKVLSDVQLGKLNARKRKELSDILSVCLQSRSLLEAGKKTHSHAKNPCDSLKKYLQRFNIEFDGIKRVL